MSCVKWWTGRERKRVNYPASHLCPISSESPGKKKCIQDHQRNILSTMHLKVAFCAVGKGLASISVWAYRNLVLIFYVWEWACALLMDLKVTLPSLYTQQAEQGSQGLTVTRAARFRDTRWTGKHHCQLQHKCNSHILSTFNATTSNILRFKNCSCQTRDSKMEQTSNLSTP